MRTLILSLAMLPTITSADLLVKFPYDVNSYLSAISEIESGNKPSAIGKRGERTCYQITKAVWHANCSSPFCQPYTTCPQISREVAIKHLLWIHKQFTAKNGMMPLSVGTYYLIWNVGWDRWNKYKRLPKNLQLKQIRFTNLYKSYQHENKDH